MDPVEIAARGLLLLAAVLAAVLSRPRFFAPARALAVLLGLEVGDDVVRLALRFAILAPARAAGRIPFAGLERMVFHVDQALLLGWSALTLHFVVGAFLGPAARLRGPVLLAVWALLSAAVAGIYPSLRGEALLTVYEGVHGVTVIAGAIALGIFLVREGRPGRMQWAAAIILGGDAAAFLGPYLHAPIVWGLAHLQNLLVYLLLVLLLGRWLWLDVTTSRGSSSPSRPSPSSSRSG